MSLSYSPRAQVDRAQIWLEGVERFGEAQAQAYIESLHDTLQETLGTCPNAGRARPEFGPDIRSFPIIPFVAFYRIVEKRIEVVRILHGHRDISEALLSSLVAV